jgi:DNA primase
VIELIHHELDKDELTFSHALYSKIYALFVEGLLNNELYTASFLKRQEDQEIVHFVSDIESNDHELSAKWFTNYNITTRTEGDRINETAMNAIYAFKSSKIEQKITEIRKKLQHADELSDVELMDLLAEQMAYEKVKILFADKLGRIILR